MIAKSKSASGLEELQRKIASGSHDPDHYTELSEFLVKAGRYNEAIDLHQKALSLDFSGLQKAKIQLDLAFLYNWLEKPRQAILEAEKARLLLPEESEIGEGLFLLGMADSLIAQCSPDHDASNEAARSALERLTRLITENPDFENAPFVFIQSARLQNRLGNPKAAIKVCNDCLNRELDPDDRMDCVIELVEALRCEKQFAEAERVVKDALRLTESNKEKSPRLYCTLGLILKSLDLLVEACDAFERALSNVDKKSHESDRLVVLKEAYWNLGELYYELREYQKSINVLQKLLLLYPEDDLYRRDILVSLGQGYQSTGNLTEARLCYEQVLRSPHASEDEKASTQQQMGIIYYDLGSYDVAIAAFEVAVNHFTWAQSFYGDTILWLGNCYYAKGDYKRASDCYRKVLVSTSASERDRTAAQKYITQLPEAFRVTLQ